MNAEQFKQQEERYREMQRQIALQQRAEQATKLWYQEWKTYQRPSVY